MQNNYYLNKHCNEVEIEYTDEIFLDCHCFIRKRAKHIVFLYYSKSLETLRFKSSFKKALL